LVLSPSIAHYKSVGKVAVDMGRGMTRAYIMYTICNSLESQLSFRLIKCFLVCLKKIDYSLVIAKKEGASCITMHPLVTL
ncbi:MAG: hypothetical protein ACLS29_10320, partial [Prevotellamassilia sp.]